MSDMEQVRERDWQTFEHYDRWTCFRCGRISGRAAVAFDYEMNCPSCNKAMRLVSRSPREEVRVLDGLFAPPDGLPKCTADGPFSRYSGWECVESDGKHAWTFIPSRLRCPS